MGYPRHIPRPLPDPSQYPYGLVVITVWTELPIREDENHIGSWSGKSFIAQGSEWKHDRSREILNEGDVVDWSFEGYRFDSFNRQYLLNRDRYPNPLVRLAMWALDRWSVDVGLKTKMDDHHDHQRIVYDGLESLYPQPNSEWSNEQN